jgi:hypothetical protein
MPPSDPPISPSTFETFALSHPMSPTKIPSTMILLMARIYHAKEQGVK